LSLNNMLWLAAAVLAYLLFALVSLGDRHLLLGAPNPKVYTFYVGLLGIASVLLIPFVGFSIPSAGLLLFCFLAALNYVLFLYLIYTAIEKHEVSRIIPSVGALVPLITFAIIFPFSGIPSFKEIAAFIFLIAGSIVANANLSKSFSLKTLKICFIVALFSSLGFVFSKYAFIFLPFWTAFIWTRIFVFIISLFFIFSPAVRKELAGKRKSFTRKKSFLFAIIQVLGALAFVLQNWAIALAGLVYLPIINALQGVQYIFLFIFALIISFKFSKKAVKEDLSRRAIFQKALALAVMTAGFAILAY